MSGRFMFFDDLPDPLAPLLGSIETDTEGNPIVLSAEGATKGFDITPYIADATFSANPKEGTHHD